MSRTQLPPLPPCLESKSSGKKIKDEIPNVTKTYSLSSTNIKYTLPAVSSLQPSLDTKPGQLDTWPAHAEGPRPPKLGADEAHKTNEALSKGNYKPKFLEQLETFLKKELRALSCLESKPSDKRLQAFREAFEYLIEDFKTYRPILSAIKNEYEMMIIHQRDKIRELEPFKTMLVTVSEQCEKTLLAMKEEEKADLKEMKKENDKLLKVINDLKENELTLSTQVEKLQEELGAEYLKYRNECDARKMLIADMNDLKAQQEDASKNSMLETESVDSKKEDATFLRIALKKARDDIELKNHKLAQMEADYGDVVPRRDYERLKEQYQKLEKNLEHFKQDQDVLMKEHNTLLNVQRQTEEEKKEYVKECEHLRRCATPRPQWNKCARYIEGGDERWKQLSKDKSSEELVDILLAEMTGNDVAVIQAGAGVAEEFFEGQGTASDVPKYLRYEGQIRNRRISKRDALLFIQDFWKERSSPDVDRSDPEFADVSNFMYSYLELRFGSEAMIFEWAYNIQDACQRYQHEPRIALFYSVLNGEIDEQLYHDQRALLEKLSGVLITIDGETGNQGSVSKDVLASSLRICFPLWEKTAFEEILSSIEETNEGMISYKELLSEDEEGGRTTFADKILEQDRVERRRYVKEIEIALEGKSDITEDELKKAFLNIDSQLPETTLNNYVSRGFHEAATKPDGQVDVMTIIKRLHNSSVRRFGPKS